MLSYDELLKLRQSKTDWINNHSFTEVSLEKQFKLVALSQKIHETSERAYKESIQNKQYSQAIRSFYIGFHGNSPWAFEMFKQAIAEPHDPPQKKNLQTVIRFGAG